MQVLQENLKKQHEYLMPWFDNLSSKLFFNISNIIVVSAQVTKFFIMTAKKIFGKIVIEKL